MKNSKTRKTWGKLTAKELGEATTEFDGPLPPSRYKPLSAAQRALFERAHRAGSRSTSRRGGQRKVVVKMDDDVLRRSEAYAAEHNMSLSEFVNRSVRGSLTIVE